MLLQRGLSEAQRPVIRDAPCLPAGPEPCWYRAGELPLTPGGRGMGEGVMARLNTMKGGVHYG